MDKTGKLGSWKVVGLRTLSRWGLEERGGRERNEEDELALAPLCGSKLDHVLVDALSLPTRRTSFDVACSQFDLVNTIIYIASGIILKSA